MNEWIFPLAARRLPATSFVMWPSSSVGGGRIIASHSVCLSVCPVLAYLQKSVTCFRPTLRTCGIFCFVYICGPHTVGRSATQACCCCCCCWPNFLILRNAAAPVPRNWRGLGAERINQSMKNPIRVFRIFYKLFLKELTMGESMACGGSIFHQSTTLTEKKCSPAGPVGPAGDNRVSPT